MEPPPLPATGSAPDEPHSCWRCHKASYPNSEARCPHCFAPLPYALPAADPFGAGPEGRHIGAILKVFVLMLAISLVFAFIGAELTAEDIASDPGVAERVLIEISVFEAIDTVIVLVLLAALWKSRPRPLPRRAALGWLLLLPMLAIALGFNFFYHDLVQQYVGYEAPPDGLSAHPEFRLWVLIVVCVQPAIVEELFFRYLCLEAMRRIMGPVGAVIVTSIMFGLAHLGVFGSLPALIVVGVVLGTLRLLSGSLLIPMILHFLHNLAIVGWEIYVLS